MVKFVCVYDIITPYDLIADDTYLHHSSLSKVKWLSDDINANEQPQQPNQIYTMNVLYLQLANPLVRLKHKA